MISFPKSVQFPKIDDKLVQAIALFIVIIGGLNWLSIGLFNVNPVADNLDPEQSKIVYTIVGGASAFLAIVQVLKLVKM
jgi:uncharacterized membrane protein YuzA (DUF378 family)